MCEGALASELCTSSRLSITEDYLRSAIMRGLILSNPAHGDRVAREYSVSWNNNPCIRDQNHTPGSGRPLQHDVAIQPNDDDAGAFCELKWLTQANSKSVASDIWKLALSRSTEAEGSAARSYLLVGGLSHAFSGALSHLRGGHLNLRWSAAGGGGNTPAPTTLALKRSFTTSLSSKALFNLTGWGNNPTHYRSPPAVWASLRASVRARWYRTVSTPNGSVGWRLILWELDHRSVGNRQTIDWETAFRTAPRTCAVSD